MVILQTCRRLRPCSTMQSGPNGLSYSDVLYPLLEFIPIWQQLTDTTWQQLTITRQEMLNAKFTKSELIYLLVLADKEMHLLLQVHIGLDFRQILL